ncbi:MAG: aromatic ring-hydroxylating dioxygenase subunit alpha [Cyanobacteria bacterium P01_E01_bin.34]
MGVKTKLFNNTDCFIEGWYWALASNKLKISRVERVTLLGRDLALYRDDCGQAVAMDAYCPHMGAHLGEGCVEGEGIRCGYHGWKFDNSGSCVDLPCLGKAFPISVQTWPTAEHYGMVWVWTGQSQPRSLPIVPELDGIDCDVAFGRYFLNNCHPNVALINAIDANHFNSVHDMPVEIDFSTEHFGNEAIVFRNTTRGGSDYWLARLLQPFYANEATYSMCYWYGNVGTATLGPDFQHFYIMFALRPIDGGHTEGHMILLTPKRRGLGGWLHTRLLLWLTKQVGDFFAKGDRQIFRSIQFDLKTPTKADQAVVDYIHHVESQTPLAWGSWETYSPSESADSENPASQNRETHIRASGARPQPLEVV